MHLLRGYYNNHSKLWDEHLHYVQHAYNHAMHSSIHRYPFETCLGYFPKSRLDIYFEKEGKEDGENDANKANRFI